MQLEKITFDNMESFLELINSNFAMILNSPFYSNTPIPPDAPIPGEIGQRGSRFIFASFSRFSSVFDNLSGQPVSIVNLTYINSLISDNYNNLLSALNVQELVNGDVVVLQYNTEMIQYDSTNSVFISTGMYFNTQTNLLSNLTEQINTSVSAVLNNFVSQLNNIMFVNYSSVSRNFGIGNSINDETFHENASIYFPVINGLMNQNSGDNMSEYENETYRHRYFGLNQTFFGTDSRPSQTTVIGSMRRYAQLLSNASANNRIQLSSDYAPSSANLPGLVVLQNNDLSGILIGSKNDEDLKRFASIYKNSSKELVIETDYEPLSSNKGVLKMSKLLLSWNKSALIENKLEIGGDFVMYNNPNVENNKNNINTPFLRSGLYSSLMPVPNNDLKYLDFGYEQNAKAYQNSIARFFGDNFRFVSSSNNNTTWANKVFVTDQYGNLLTNKSLENYMSLLQQNEVLTISKFFGNVSSPNQIVTSDYINQLGKLLWGVNGFSSSTPITPGDDRNFSNIWFKDQFAGYNIPKIQLNESLCIGKNVQNTLQVYFEVDAINKKINIGNQTASDTEINLRYSKFHIENLKQYTVLSMDSNKDVTPEYELAVLTNQQKADMLSESTFDQSTTFAGFVSKFAKNDRIGGSIDKSYLSKVLTGVHWEVIMGLFDKIRAKFTNYYTKSEIDSMLPVGTIIAWTPTIRKGETQFLPADDDAIPVLIPKGWVPCCGGYASDGTTEYKIPNLVHKFVYGYRPNYIQGVSNDCVLTYCNGTTQAAGYQHYGGKLRDIIGNNQMILEEKHIPPHTHAHGHTTSNDGSHDHYRKFGGPNVTPTEAGFEYGTSFNLRNPVPTGYHSHNVKKSGLMSTYLRTVVAGTLLKPDYLKFGMEPENENVSLDREGRASILLQQYGEPANVHENIYGGNTDLSNPYYTVKPFRMVSRSLKAFYLYKLPNNFKVTSYIPDYKEA